jgi:hypothetical protein
MRPRKLYSIMKEHQVLKSFARIMNHPRSASEHCVCLLRLCIAAPPQHASHSHFASIALWFYFLRRAPEGSIVRPKAQFFVVILISYHAIHPRHLLGCKMSSWRFTDLHDIRWKQWDWPAEMPLYPQIHIPGAASRLTSLSSRPWIRLCD